MDVMPIDDLKDTSQNKFNSQEMPMRKKWKRNAPESISTLRAALEIGRATQ